MGRKGRPAGESRGVAEVSSLPAPDIAAALKLHGARMFKGDDEEAIANVLLREALPEAELLYDRDPKLGRDVPYISYRGVLHQPARVRPVDAENVVGHGGNLHACRQVRATREDVNRAGGARCCWRWRHICRRRSAR